MFSFLFQPFSANFWYLAVDPVSAGVVIGLGKLLGVAFLAGGVIVVSVITVAAVFKHIKKLRQKHRDDLLHKVAKAKIDGNQYVAVITMKNGETVGQEVIKGNNLDAEMASWPEVTLIRDQAA